PADFPPGPDGHGLPGTRHRSDGAVYPSQRPTNFDNRGWQGDRGDVLMDSMSRTFRHRLVGISLWLLGLSACAFHSTLDVVPGVASAEPAPADSVELRFAKQVQPFLKRYCFACHGSNKPKASLDLTRDTTVTAIAKNARQWELVLDRLHAKEMPPEDAGRQPEAAEPAPVVPSILDLRNPHADRHAA